MASDTSQLLSLGERAKHLAETGLMFASDTKKADANRLIAALSKFQQKIREERGERRGEDQIMREELQLSRKCFEVKDFLKGKGVYVFVHVGSRTEVQAKPVSYEKRGLVIRGTKEAVEQSRLLLEKDSFEGETRQIPYIFQVDENWSAFIGLHEKTMSSTHRFYGYRGYDEELYGPYGSGGDDDLARLDLLKPTDVNRADEHDVLNGTEMLRVSHLRQQGMDATKLKE